MDEITGLLTTEGGVYAVTLRPVTVEVEAPVRPQARRRRMAFPKTTRIQLLGVQHHRCALCRGPLGLYDSHIDHIIPIASGGTDDFTNLQLVHMSCNLHKGAGTTPYNDDQERMPWA